MDNLWPDFSLLPEKKAPVVLLREQASLLGERTQNIVVGQVEKAKSNYLIVNGKHKSFPFVYSFFIISQALDNYQYKLFTIGHDIDLFPVVFQVDDEIEDELFKDDTAFKGDTAAIDFSEPLKEKDKDIIVSNEGDFLRILGKIFSSTKTIKIVHAILAQVRS